MLHSCHLWTLSLRRCCITKIHFWPWINSSPLTNHYHDWSGLRGPCGSGRQPECNALALVLEVQAGSGGGACTFGFDEKPLLQGYDNPAGRRIIWRDPQVRDLVVSTMRFLIFFCLLVLAYIRLSSHHIRNKPPNNLSNETTQLHEFHGSLYIPGESKGLQISHHNYHYSITREHIITIFHSYPMIFTYYYILVIIIFREYVVKFSFTNKYIPVCYRISVE